MSGLSIAHALTGLLTLLLAVGILVRRKGDRLLKQPGWIISTGRPRRPLWYFNGGVVLVTAVLVIMQAT